MLRIRYSLLLTLLLSWLPILGDSQAMAQVCSGTLITAGETVSAPAGAVAFADLLANDSQDCGAPLWVDISPDNCPGQVQDFGDGTVAYIPFNAEENCTVSYTVHSADGRAAPP